MKSLRVLNRFLTAVRLQEGKAGQPKAKAEKTAESQQNRQEAINAEKAQRETKQETKQQEAAGQKEQTKMQSKQGEKRLKKPHHEKPYRCHIQYSSNYSNVNGFEDFNERIVEKYPDMDIIHERSNDGDFKVIINKLDEKEVSQEQIEAKDFFKDFEQTFDSIEKAIDRQFKDIFGYDADFGPYKERGSLGREADKKQLGGQKEQRSEAKGQEQQQEAKRQEQRQEAKGQEQREEERRQEQRQEERRQEQRQEAKGQEQQQEGRQERSQKRNWGLLLASKCGEFSCDYCVS